MPSAPAGVGFRDPVVSLSFLVIFFDSCLEVQNVENEIYLYMEELHLASHRRSCVFLDRRKKS